MRHPGLAAQRCRPEPLRLHRTRVGTAPPRNSRRRWASKARKRGDVLSCSKSAASPSLSQGSSRASKLGFPIWSQFLLPIVAPSEPYALQPAVPTVQNRRQAAFSGFCSACPPCSGVCSPLTTPPQRHPGRRRSSCPSSLPPSPVFSIRSDAPRVARCARGFAERESMSSGSRPAAGRSTGRAE